jgi:hypothetical protein
VKHAALSDGYSIYVQKLYNSTRNIDDIFASPDSLVDPTDPYLHIANFSDQFVTFGIGQALGTASFPNDILALRDEIPDADRDAISKRANFIRSRIRADKLASVEEMAGEEPLDGGPKASEVPPVDVKESELLSSVDISKQLTLDQTRKLRKIIWDNKEAFGVGSRLGHYPVK